MNEFDEEKKQADVQPENSAAADNQSAPTEGNTTYHYAYRKPEEAAGTGSFNNFSANSSAASYYAPPVNNGTQTEPMTGNTPAKKKNKVVIGIVITVIICVIAAILGMTAYLTSDAGKKPEDGNTNTNSSAQVETKNQGDVATTDKDGNFTVAGIAENCIDSCVGITVYSEANNYSNFYSYGYGQNSQQQSGEQVKSGEGSGILMLEDGGRTYIITCAHVISDGSSFKVTTNDGEEYDAYMVAFDAQTDIGVLYINKTGLKIAEFADSTSTVLGEQVVAIGCPGGLEFMNSVTSGFVSALARPISSTIGYNTDCIQIDAAINPGNSGGALFNMQGQVIGVNSSKIAATEYEGIGFAVPSNTAVSTANSLIKSGYVEGRAKLGITYKNITTYQNSNSILAALEKLGYENAEGTMVINEIAENSDMKNKDVREYDMIVAVNGETMTSTDIITSVLSNSKPGDTIKLTIARIENNQIDTFEIECTLIESKG